MSRNKLLKQIGYLIGFATVFVLISYFARTNEATLTAIVHSGGVFGIIGFITLTAIFVIFVIPLDVVFLIPLGSAVWGVVPTALMSIAGWTIGSAIAFALARIFGVPLVERIVGLKRIHTIESHIPKRNLFWSVVFLRLAVSVDILSYALGLFSRMQWKQYVLATLIGVTPFGFYFAYAGALSFWYQILAMVLALALATIALLVYKIQREP